MKNILVPCDFSQPAEEAFRFAVQIAEKSKGEIHVLHVIDTTFIKGSPTLSYSYAFNVNFLNDIEREAAEKFQRMREKYAPTHVNVKFQYVLSTLASEVENNIRLNHIDLVIMGTRGKGNSVFGSNTDRIVRNATVPVMAIQKAPSTVKNILLPVSLLPGQLNEAFIQQIKHLQNFFQAQLHLLYINTPLFFKTDPDAFRKLEELGWEMDLGNYTIHIRSDYSVEAGIAHFAKELQPDMLAMGTHAWKGLWHFLLGSIAEDLVRKMELPIWSFPLTTN